MFCSLNILYHRPTCTFLIQSLECLNLNALFQSMSFSCKCMQNNITAAYSKLINMAVASRPPSPHTLTTEEGADPCFKVIFNGCVQPLNITLLILRVLVAESHKAQSLSHYFSYYKIMIQSIVRVNNDIVNLFTIVNKL